MNQIVVLDGVKIQIIPQDLDGDGITGEIERVRQTDFDTGIQPVMQPTELGETLVEMNKDEVDKHTLQSGIDLKARLRTIEVKNIGAFDSLVPLGVIPPDCLAFTRQVKRLSVSIDGKGRQEFVDVVAGKREQDARLAGGGLGDKIRGFMGLGGR